MTAATDQLSLRLALRTLIEWKLPPHDREYRRIVSAALAVHPFTSNLTSAPIDEVYKLDPDGTFLWYLSETLLSWSYQPAPPAEAGVATEIHNYLRVRLVEFALSKDSSLQQIPAEVADAINTALLSRLGHVQELGARALLAVVLPVSLQDRQEMFDDVSLSVGAAKGFMHRLSRIAKGYKTGVGIVSIVSNLLGIAGLILNLWNRRSEFVKRPHGELFTTGLFLTLAISGLYIFLRRGDLSTAVTKLRAVSLDRRARTSPAENLSTTSGITVLSRKVLASAVSHDARLLYGLLEHGSLEWIEYLLRTDRTATRDTLRLAISCLGRTDFPLSVRNILFEWVCTARLESA